MEKQIKLIMNESRAIHIFVNNDEKHVISSNSRNISADKIYEILAFSIDDSYTVSSENKNNLDEPVIKFFLELFEEIVNKVNNLSTDNDNSHTSEDFSDDIPF